MSRLGNGNDGFRSPAFFVINHVCGQAVGRGVDFEVALSAFDEEAGGTLCVFGGRAGACK